MPVESGEKEESETEGNASESDGAATRRDDRSRMIRFVILFIVYGLTLLVGYRYSIDTEANMWYLFNVAKHTAATMSLFGEETALETLDRPDMQAIPSPAASAADRAELNEWRHGAAVSADARDDAPLTPWELWLHRAYGLIQSGESLEDTGPRVYYRGRTGLNNKIRFLEVRIVEKRADTSIPPPERIKQRKALESELEGLKEERQALRDANGSRRVGQDKSFTFILIPDCGAIPSISIFLAGVLAFPTAWWKRLAGLAVGLPFLYAVNLGRLTSLGILAAYDTTPGRKWFEFGHHYVWQGVFIIFVVAAWLVWIELVVKRRAE